MASYSMAKLVSTITNDLKRRSFMPYKTGHLRGDGITELAPRHDLGVITFEATKIEYMDFLEYGTNPHNILGAFGRTDYWQPYAYMGDFTTLPFGVGGQFDRKFHPGSKKHVGFISVKSVNFVVKEICRLLNGKEKKV